MHHGFYSAYHNTTLRPGIVSAVQEARELYGDIPVMVTGHSMGGAMASFCALDLTVSILLLTSLLQLLHYSFLQHIIVRFLQHINVGFRLLLYEY